jgi:sodium/potassium/calcium exchanger 6
MALGSTVFAMVLLLVLFVSFSEWRVINDNNYDIEWDDFDNELNNDFDGLITEQQQSSSMLMHRRRRNRRQLRRLDSNEEDASLVTNGNYSTFLCDSIFDNTPSINSTQSIPTIRCQYARTCENSGLLLPFIFCHNTLFSTSTWMIVLFPPLLLGLTLLFRLLGSTADEYFSPSLEMFSVKLGLPPRFAGVTLLALGNGASDVSATMNAIWNDPVNGYKLSLGALTGASMFITTVVAGSVILANGGMVCRGAMLRDVVALAVTVVVVALTLEGGEVDSKTESLFISIYVVYVLIVLFADVYHRAVMLPRIKHELEVREHARQIEAGRVASLTAGDAWGNLVGGEGGRGGDEDAISIASEGPLGGGRGGGRSSRPVSPAIDDDVRSHSSAPPSTVACNNNPIIKNRALNAVLTALSNYNDVEHDFDDVDGASHRPRQDGWGVESTIEGSMPWDRPVVLHGADGVLSRHPHHHVQPGEGTDNQYSSPYRVMEDMDVVERMCVPDGSQGHPALNWVVAWHEFRQELVLHFQECWSDIIDDDESSWLDKFLMICEYPVTVARKVCVEEDVIHSLVSFLDRTHHYWRYFYIWS